MNPRIEGILNRVEGPTVLDLGCVQHDAEKADNPDWLHKHLARRYDDVVGVDILDADVQALQDRGYNVRVGDAETLDLPGVFDTVVAGELIEHLSNPGKMLDTANDHLDPGGRLVLSTPNPWAFVHVRRAAVGRLRINDEHTGWFGPTTLRQVLDRHGFDVLSIDGTAQRHRGVMGLAQALDLTYLAATTWVVAAEKR